MAAALLIATIGAGDAHALRDAGDPVQALLRARKGEPTSPKYRQRGNLYASAIYSCGPQDCTGAIQDGDRSFPRPRPVAYPHRAEIVVDLPRKPRRVRVRTWFRRGRSDGLLRPSSIRRRPTPDGDWVIRIAGDPRLMRSIHLRVHWHPRSWAKWTFATTPSG